MTTDEALRRAAEARVGRIATVRPDGTPHVVPLTFAIVRSPRRTTLYWVVDDKPKRSARLTRLENLAANPAAEVVVDAYDDDWSRLWWVRLRGTSRIVHRPAERRTALDALAEKYDAYRERRPHGPVVALDVDAVTSWSSAGD
ncbi:MAG: TIGR03668 family PPOX class F420-dependent oxidoreductase [Actinomycetota bacterium]